MSQPEGMVIAMESSRCKMAAIEMHDPRCSSLLVAVAIEIEDCRCASLVEGPALKVDDARYSYVPHRMEDPRCQNLRTKW
jgi:hypothetical protein